MIGQPGVRIGHRWSARHARTIIRNGLPFRDPSATTTGPPKARKAMTEIRPTAPEYALSIRQPWATLLVHGLKTIEVRRWPTARRGRILIHAAGVSDSRPEAWRYVPPQLVEEAHLLGGIVGRCELVGCVVYRSRDAFVADCPRHLNEADWFESAGLYGFQFRQPEVIPFHRCPGWMRFFPVELRVEPVPRTE